MIEYYNMQLNVDNDSVHYLNYFYNFYVTHFDTSNSSNERKYHKGVHFSMQLTWIPSLEML